MATIKVACPKCGQKVSGDETFHGTTVECPICSSDIVFPGSRREVVQPPGSPDPVLPVSGAPVPPESLPETPSKPLPSPEKESPAAIPPAESPAAPADLPAKSAVPLETKTDDEPELPPSPIWGAISFVSAVLSVVTCVGGVLFAPIAIIFGHTALAKARHSPVQPAPGHTLGAIGLLIGYVSLVITILVLVILAFFGETIRDAFVKPVE